MTLIYSFRKSFETKFIRLWNTCEFPLDGFVSFPREKLFDQLNILEFKNPTRVGPAVLVEILERSSNGNNVLFHTGWMPLYNRPIEIVDVNMDTSTANEYLLFDGRFNLG